ncbi:MAG TPA: hypothetical protein VNQ77_17340 [Frankiaceae bacterium]|nr:hypothetical protein [Frankiaceae bacterium]
MTTRRAFLALLLAAALNAPGAGAASAPQIRDVTGDWVLGGQDIVWARVSDVLVDGVPHLRAELRLASAPVEELQNHYVVDVVHQCRKFRFHGYVGQLDPEPITGVFTREAYCFGNDDDPGAQARYPMTVSLRGTTVTWVAPYPEGIRRGSRLTRFFAAACSVTPDPLTFDVSDSYPPGPVGAQDGDHAAAPKAVHVVGSDLPRR